MSDRPEPWLERARRDAVLAGDAEVWSGWVVEVFDRVARYVGWRLNHSDAAEDVLQEVFLIAARRMGRFDPDRGPFEAWLCGIAANVIRNQIRASARRRHESLPGDLAVQSRGVRNHVAEALDSLPERYEQVLRAKYLDGLTVTEIASNRGETEKTIESLLTRARQAFREAYDRDEGQS